MTRRDGFTNGCILGLTLGLVAAACRAGVEPAVLEAEAARVTVVNAAAETVVAVFAGPGGGGSGVLISRDGYALSNFHVTQPAGAVMRCGLSDGRLYDAVIVGLDPTGDVALVKLLGRDDFPCAVLADSDTVAVGDACFTAGNPFLLATDLRPSISAGIVSGIHRYQFPAGTILEYTDCIQVDAAINPGNSGGGLFDAAGRLIGVNGRASFEKRGRVNVGAGYAISANQVRNFLGCLRAGRIVDHATLGAVVSTSADGEVFVSDILESSDAWRRGLRHDDEIVSLAGRPVRTVNAFKNVLGTLPAGWQVPLVFRRAGRRRDILVRLGGVHAPAQLNALAAGGGPEASPQRTETPAADLPEAARGLVEPRPGYANYHFNVVERDRVAAAIARHRPAGNGTWRLSGRLAGGRPFVITLADATARIDLPTGSSSLDSRGDLDRHADPPGSGGMLAALVLWRRLLLEGPEALGRTSYWGTAAFDPTAIGQRADVDLVDVLASTTAGVEALFAIDAEGRVVRLELWLSPDADPCELRFDFPLPGTGPGVVPERITATRGTEPYDSFTITTTETDVGGDDASGGRP